VASAEPPTKARPEAAGANSSALVSRPAGAPRPAWSAPSPEPASPLPVSSPLTWSPAASPLPSWLRPALRRVASPPLVSSLPASSSPVSPQERPFSPAGRPSCQASVWHASPVPLSSSSPSPAPPWREAVPRRGVEPPGAERQLCGPIARFQPLPSCLTPLTFVLHALRPPGGPLDGRHGRHRLPGPRPAPTDRLLGRAAAAAPPRAAASACQGQYSITAALRHGGWRAELR
jgi:hypothetical protein